MVPRKLTTILIVAVFLLSTQAWAGSSPERVIEQRDHATLVTLYKQQAEEFRLRAKHWDDVAESYERHTEDAGKEDALKHAKHCRVIAKELRKAAEEADALVTEHRAMMPHGMIQ